MGFIERFLGPDSVLNCHDKHDCDNRENGCGATTEAKVASETLAAGEVIAVPTDTIYGIAALIQNKQAVEKLYKIKKRNPSKTLFVL